MNWRQIVGVAVTALSVGTATGYQLGPSPTGPTGATRKLDTIVAKLNHMEDKNDRLLRALAMLSLESDRYLEKVCGESCPPRHPELEEASYEVRRLLREGFYR